MKRAVAAAISRLTVWASSISAGQFARTKAAPPIQCRRRIRGMGQSRGLVALGDVEGRIGQILGQDAAGRTRDHAKCRKPSRRTVQAMGDTSGPVNGNRECPSHIRPPPGTTPGIRRRDKPPADPRMTAVGTACDTFTAVMLSMGNPSAILPVAASRGQSVAAFVPALSSRSAYRSATETAKFVPFHKAFCRLP